MSRERLSELDRAKGLAILLVVIGHVVARQPPAGNEWYEIGKYLIYYFHMPFFMFLSGFIIEYTYKPLVGFSQFSSYVKSKFLRLMPAFLIMAILIYLGKLIASHFIQVDNLQGRDVSALLDILLYPAQSSASSLWYIYVLFLFYLIFPVIHWLIQRKVIWMVVGLCAFIVQDELTHLFMLNRVAEFLLFIMVGAWVARNYETFSNHNYRYGWLWALIFVIALVASEYLLLPKLILGLLSIPALMFFVSAQYVKDSAILTQLGKYVFVIYLLNTIVIGLVKGVGLKFVSWDGINFIPYFIVLMLAGLYVPILIKQFLFSKSPLLDKYTT
ncbi:acyltransferase [Methylobacillus gramineus]|uniref:acyltransferase family protein n=1 Tax=Methylobacillus gramineus TaxID=755169 RepID=UPI001CFFCBF6|nr:acyltransferase [Methylobacillus gramineus]MCB5183697.1 acyltransferase [Methylobacillus gramineus]